MGGVDQGGEELGMGFVVTPMDSFLCEVGKSKRPRRTNRTWLELCVNLAFRCSGDGQQVFHGDSAGCSLLVRLVDRRPVALAQRGERTPPLANVRRRRCPFDMDPRIKTLTSR